MTPGPRVPYAALMSTNEAFSWSPGRWQRGSPAWPNWRVDVLPAVLIGAFQIGLTHVAGRHQLGHHRLDALGMTLLALGALSLIGRRRWPVPTLGAAIAATLAFVLLDYPNGPIWLPLIFALFNVMLRGYRLVAWGAIAVGYAAFMWLPYLVGAEPRAPTVAGAVGLAAWLLVLGTVAEIVRIRRERSLEAARMRAEESRRRASEERLRIARELHDVLAHNISLINVQAGVALHLIDEQPEQARTALAAIKQTSKEALGELRSVLSVLRAPDEASSAPRDPAPSVARLEGLVSRASAAGLTVRTEVSGTPRTLPTGVDMAAFRIVQEALTNVARHAGHATATIRVGYGEHDLTVQVDDNGNGTGQPSTAGGGSGIPGMRERATALGGELEAGPRPGGGFRVLARLPLNGAEAEGAS
jgi:signal transduction histidine kinase